MKRLLVFLTSAVLLLAWATVSLAVVRVNCDFRFEMVHESEEKGSGSVYDNADFKINLSEKFNDSVEANLRMRMLQSQANDAAGEDDFYADLYYLTIKTKWADLTAGYFEYFVHPSRTLAVVCDSYDFVEENPGMITAKIPLKKGFYTKLAYVVDDNADRKYDSTKKTVTYTNTPALGDDAYDVCFGYKGQNYGAELHYFDTKMPDSNIYMSSAFCFDAFYQLKNGWNICTYGTCPQYGIDTAAKPAQYEDEAMVGLEIPKLFGTKLYTSFEYEVTGRTQAGIKWERAPYAIKMVYPIASKAEIEWQHWNHSASNDVINKLRLRFRF